MLAVQKSPFHRFLSVMVIVSLVGASCLPGYAQAAMVATDSVVTEYTAQMERRDIIALFDRRDVQDELLSYGVTHEEAKERIAALSDAEVLQLAARLDQEPAGQGTVESVVGAALIVFLVLLFTDILCLTNVFGFTRCAGR